MADCGALKFIPDAGWKLLDRGSQEAAKTSQPEIAVSEHTSRPRGKSDDPGGKSVLGGWGVGHPRWTHVSKATLDSRLSLEHQAIVLPASIGVTAQCMFRQLGWGRSAQQSAVHPAAQAVRSRAKFPSCAAAPLQAPGRPFCSCALYIACRPPLRQRVDLAGWTPLFQHGSRLERLFANCRTPRAGLVPSAAACTPRRMQESFC